jgi:hypothetical protein
MQVSLYCLLPPVWEDESPWEQRWEKKNIVYWPFWIWPACSLLEASLLAWLLPSKGQLISEAIFLGFKSTKKQTNFFKGFLTWTSKMGNIIKNKGIFLHFKGVLISIIFFLWLNLEAMAEILSKIWLDFWEIWRHQNSLLRLADLYLLPV